MRRPERTEQNKENTSVRTLVSLEQSFDRIPSEYQSDALLLC
jgi:hypothetical protein